MTASNRFQIPMRQNRAVLAALLAALVAPAPDARAQQGGHYYVANVLPPDDYLALRSDPSAHYGQRVAILPNGTLVDVLFRRGDGWWRIRVVATGQEGWALAGYGSREWIVCCSAEENPRPVTDSASFKTPSNNIYCLASTFDGPNLRCDVQQMTNPMPPAPANCPLSWGDAYEITDKSVVGELICHGDTTVQQDSVALQYGAVWQGFGFTCTSEATGLTCFNAGRHGFFLSRNAQRVF